MDWIVFKFISAPFTDNASDGTPKNYLNTHWWDNAWDDMTERVLNSEQWYQIAVLVLNEYPMKLIAKALCKPKDANAI